MLPPVEQLSVGFNFQFWKSSLQVTSPSSLLSSKKHSALGFMSPHLATLHLNKDAPLGAEPMT
jgi:hypothetical protein